MPTDKSQVAAIIAVVRRYCVEHPRAGDTLEGISRWWLGSDLRACQPADAEAALEILVQEGIMGRRPLPDGSFVYFSRPSSE